VSRLGSSELFLLSVFATALLAAFISSAVFGLSLALGAFVAGIIVSESDLAHQAAGEILPFRDLFAVLFFVSVGMLLDPAALVSDWPALLALVVVAMGVKAVAGALAARLLGLPLRSALLLGATIAQVGEFSFLLAEQARTVHLVDGRGYNLVLGTAVLSIVLTPPLVKAAAALVLRVERRAPPIDPPLPGAGPVTRGEATSAGVDERLAVVVLGAGRVGRTVVRAVRARGLRCVVVDRDQRALDEMGDLGAATLFGDAASRAIMTTDTYPKLVSRTVQIGGVNVAINGFCKGAGMIAPDMATMLAYIFTDAAITQPLLQRLVSAIADQTFNCITVDGDTSTSDTVLAFATGAAAKRGAPMISDMADAACGAFAAGLRAVMHDLALMIVKDGEGLTKFVTVQVWGAEHDRAARRIAFSIANSPILKTAIAGEDPNWGRVVMAVGKSGEAADRDKLSIWFGDHIVARNGERAEEYVEKTVAAYMKNGELTIRVDVGIGGGAATVWTCDLTHDYVEINSDYRS